MLIKLVARMSRKKAIKKKACLSCANIRAKNRAKNGSLTKICMFHEGVFSKMSEAVRCRTIIRVKFKELMKSYAYNLRRLVSINAEPIPLLDF